MIVQKLDSLRPHLFAALKSIGFDLDQQLIS
uniref:Uncharacterized protein n=1 Tax=Arundo donax TaxID=35708 RepID=A0A0A9FRT9_ARUDO